MRWAARWWAPDQVVPFITLKCRIASVAFLAAAKADGPVPPPEPARSTTSKSDGMTIRSDANLVRQRRARSMSASPSSLLKRVCRWVSLLDVLRSIRRCATVLQPARFSLSSCHAGLPGTPLTQKAGRMRPALGLLEWVLDLPDDPGRSDRALLNLLDGPTLGDQIEHADPRGDVVLVSDLLSADQEWNVYLPGRDEGTHGDTIGPHQDHQTGYPAPGLPYPPVQVANQLSRFIVERPDKQDDGLMPATDLKPVNDPQPVFQRHCRRFRPSRQRRPGGSP